MTIADVPDFPNLIYGFRKSRLHRPLLCTPDEETFFLFDVLRTTDPAKVSQAVAQNRCSTTRRGRLVAGSTRSARCHCQRTIGSGISNLLSDLFALAKRLYDPEEILTPGPGIFD